MEHTGAKAKLHSGRRALVRSKISVLKSGTAVSPAAFAFCLLEVQIRLVIRMLGALCVIEQGGDREQLQARIFFPVRALVEAGCCGGNHGASLNSRLDKRKDCMACWLTKFTTLLAILGFVLGTALCAVACGSDDDDLGVVVAPHHCTGQCVCHGATVSSICGTESPLLMDDSDFALAAVIDNSLLLPASIFNPPRA
jgi:hypothetical protein